MDSLETIINNIRGGIILCNFNTKKKASTVIYINKGWTEVTGYTMEELNLEKGGNPQALVFAEDKPGVDRLYSEQVSINGEYELMYRIVHKSGALRWVIDKGVVSEKPGGIMQNQSIITEVTTIKEQEEHLRLLAQIDQLTELNNKATFTMLTQTVITRQRNRCHALLLLDIDHFKGINDTFGHAFGDKVLEGVALKLRELFRSCDVVGRVGGDEFAVLLTDIQNHKLAEKKAEELRKAVCTIKIPGKAQHPQITVSVGISVFTTGRSYDALYEEADAALYYAKNHGRNRISRGFDENVN